MPALRAVTDAMVELAIRTFPSDDDRFRFAVAAAFDAVAAEEGVLVADLVPTERVLLELEDRIRFRYPKARVHARDPWTRGPSDPAVTWYVYRGDASPAEIA
ncbi:MAG TPA: hypothetical protein VNJ28_08395 [Candidatus Limnocylindrales bacterium]|nr:hypothetical protein [Candidatus Limnocylindrales bacterium]